MLNSKSKIIILGSKGFLGSCLYENFSKDVRYDVIGISRDNIDLTSNQAVSFLKEILGRDAILIMAASVLNKDKSYTAFREEITMFNNLARQELLCQIKHFILISSTVIYGYQSNTSITEYSPVKPYDIYSTAKLIGEIILRRVCDDFQIGLTIVRPGILYGRDDNRSPLFRFINDVSSNQSIKIHGDGLTRLVWLHRKDAFRAIQSIVDKYKIGEYNIIADGDGISPEDLAKLVFKICGKETSVEIVKSKKISPKLRFNLVRFLTDFPGFEFTKMEEGIKEYFPMGSKFTIH